METIIEMSDSLRKKGSSYFETKDLELFIGEINKKYNSPICSYKILLQEGESVQLECSFFTKKAIFDFTLKTKSIETITFFLKDITTVKEDITSNNRSLTIYNGGLIAIVYKAYTDNDKRQLADYANCIISEINKI